MRALHVTQLVAHPAEHRESQAATPERRRRAEEQVNHEGDLEREQQLLGVVARVRRQQTEQVPPAQHAARVGRDAAEGARSSVVAKLDQADFFRLSSTRVEEIP